MPNPPIRRITRSLPRITHVPVPRPTDQPKGDKPPRIKIKKPLPPVQFTPTGQQASSTKGTTRGSTGARATKTTRTSLPQVSRPRRI